MFHTGVTIFSQSEQIKEIFALFDTDGGGGIDHQEVALVYWPAQCVWRGEGKGAEVPLLPISAAAAVTLQDNASVEPVARIIRN